MAADKHMSWEEREAREREKEAQTQREETRREETTHSAEEGVTENCGMLKLQWSS